MSQRHVIVSRSLWDVTQVTRNVCTTGRGVTKQVTRHVLCSNPSVSSARTLVLKYTQPTTALGTDVDSPACTHTHVA